MPEDEKKPEEEKEKSDESKDEDYKEDMKKEKTSSVIDTLSKIESAVSKFDTSKIEKAVAEISDRVKALETLKTIESTKATEESKAMEEPTDLPLKPQVQSSSDDIGAKVKVPDTYQSNSQQASIGDSDPQNERKEDKGGLAMQEKSQPVEKSTPVVKSIEIEKGYIQTTDVQRPPSYETAQEILKARGPGESENAVLKACRETPYEEMGTVARRMMKGEFGLPTDEVGRW